MKTLGLRTIGCVFLACVSAAGQTPQTKSVPCPVKSVPSGWKTYVNQRYGFCFSYPPTYTVIAKPWLTEYAETPEAAQYFRKAVRENRMVFLEHKQSVDGPIQVALDDEAFDLQNLARAAPTGWEGPPEPKKLGSEMFYYYGAGGGGVQYSHRYFFDLSGKTLEILFGAAKGNNVPSEETVRMEEPLLRTFRTFQPK